MFASDHGTVGSEGEGGEEERFQLKTDLVSNPAVVQRTLNLGFKSQIFLRHWYESVCVPVLMYMNITKITVGLFPL